MAKKLVGKVRFSRLPSAIKEARLINWRSIDGRKRPTDPEGSPVTGLNTDPPTVPFEIARRSVVKGRTDGIGLPIVRSGLCAIDLDDCVVDGRIAPWAMAIVVQCNSYAEFSPSGDGIHIYMSGTPKCGNHTQVAQGFGHMDVFANKGFVTLTGRPLPGYAKKSVRNGTRIVDEVYKAAVPASRVIKKIRKNPTTNSLFRGDTSAYESPSEADLAFVSRVAPLAHGDRSLIMEIVRNSGLYRKKWDRPDYAKRTLDKILLRDRGMAFGDDLRLLAHPIADFLDQDLPAPEWIVEGFLAKGTISMVFGPGGVGKSQFLYSLLMSIDQGEPFMYWSVPKKRRVLLIDTEMPERLIQSRLRNWFGDSKPDSSLILSSARFRAAIDSNFKLDNEDHQALLYSLIQEFDIEVVIIDPLAPALDCDENSNNDVGLYMPFLTQLRDEGITVVLSHHSGKSEDSGQRGASRRRDYLDMSLQLVNAKMLKNARFSTKFDKIREETPEPPTWTAELVWREAFCWELSSNLPQDDEPLVQLIAYLFEHSGKLNVSQMARDLGYNRGRVYSILNRAAAHDLIDSETRELTDAGIGFAERVSIDDDD